MMWTVAIPTFARTSVLPEALESVRRQIRPGNTDVVEVLVFNDCPWQHLIIRREGWPAWMSPRVVNLRERLSIGDKRQAMVEAADGDWIAWLDDDDLLMPWYLRQATFGPEHVMVLQRRVFFQRQVDWSIDELGGGIPFLVNTDFAKEIGFSCIDKGEDNDFRSRALRALGDTAKDRVAHSMTPGYCVRFGDHVTHASKCQPGMFVADAEKRLELRQEPQGTIIVWPSWNEDYKAALTGRFKESSHLTNL